MIKINLKFITIFFLLIFNYVYSQKSPKIPTFFSLKDSLLPVKHQGDRAACASFAFIAMIEYELKKQTGYYYNLSEQYLTFHLKNKRVKNEYGVLTDCFEVIKKNGFVQENQLAYQTSYFSYGFPCDSFFYNDSAAPYECFAHQTPPQELQNEIINLNLLPLAFKDYNDKDILNRCKNIYEKQRTYIVTVPLMAVEYADKHNGIIQYEDTFSEDDFFKLPMHFMVIVGYDLNKQVFIVKNSWGKSFGKDGYGTISFNQYLNNRNYLISFNKFKINNKKLPKSKLQNSIKVNDFNPSFDIQEDKTINLKVNANIDSIGTRRIELMVQLIKISKIGDTTIRTPISLNNDEFKILKIDFAGKNFTYFSDKSIPNLKLNDTLFTNFNLSKDIILSETFQNILHEDESEIEIEFELICSDDENYKKIYASKSFPIEKKLLIKN